MSKIPKVVAGYLPAKDVPQEGTHCGACRDFIKFTSECRITQPAKVSGPLGTCILFLQGQASEYAQPQRLIPKSVIGYIEGKPDVPTKCAKCEYYEKPGRIRSLCAKVGDSDDDTVEAGGCCNAYQVRK